MANYNKVFLMGNLTRDPEMRYTPKGTPVAQLGLAVNRTWKDESGQPVTDTLFVDIEAFGAQAETLGRYVRKGNPIFVEGRLRMDTWDDKQTGQRRSRLRVVLEAFQFLGGPRSESGMDPGGAPQQRPAYGGGWNNPAAPQPRPYSPQQYQQQPYQQQPQPYGGSTSQQPPVQPYGGGAASQPKPEAGFVPPPPPGNDGDPVSDDDVPF